MNSLELIPLEVVVSDPWDFTTDTGSVVFSAVVGPVLAAGLASAYALLLDFGDIVTSVQGSARYFVATPDPRDTVPLEVFLHGVTIECSLLGVSDEVAAIDDRALEARSAWRGGTPAARATLSVTDRRESRGPRTLFLDPAHDVPIAGA